MLRWFKKLDSESSGLAETERNFDRMLDHGRHVFDEAAGAYLGAADPEVIREDLVSTDKEINHLEREIRRTLLVHATVYGATEFPACLVMMSITKDAERIGDYAKNIFDLAVFRPKVKGSPYFDQLVELKGQISRILAETRELYGTQNSAGAPAFIQLTEDLKDVCDDAIEEILTTDQARHVEAADPASSALCFRYYKRVISHARNIVTSIVVPVDRLDYFDESRDTRDGDPPI